MDAQPLKILLLAHDLTDATIQKRVKMLRAGGAKVSVAGFRRVPEPVTDVAGCIPTNFGQTFNGAFIRRLGSVIREVIFASSRSTIYQNVDIIIARNLEMLAIAVRGRKMQKPAPAVIYECLDIHRLLLNNSFVGTIVRWLEGWLTRSAAALFTSSPAFISEYFEKRSHVHLPTKILENKVLKTADRSSPFPAHASGPPWIIGWYGIIRCNKSLQILTKLVLQSQGQIEVIIRGRPALDQFENFHKTVSETEGLHFLGPYKNPEDLAAIYHEAHFTWAVDLFEEGLNSTWLLPNRLYEGGLYGSIPIALADVETGRFLNRLGIGVTLQQPLGANLEKFFNNLDPTMYRALEHAEFKVPQSTWVSDEKDCIRLVEDLSQYVGAP